MIQYKNNFFAEGKSISFSSNSTTKSTEKFPKKEVRSQESLLKFPEKKISLQQSLLKKLKASLTRNLQKSQSTGISKGKSPNMIDALLNVSFQGLHRYRFSDKNNS